MLCAVGVVDMQSTCGRGLWLLVAIWCSFGCGPAGDRATRIGESSPPLAEPTAPPLSNLLLIVLDTQRADRLQLYGGEVATPHLERLAARGVVFEQAHSHAPITGPSHASLFTGLLPHEHDVHNNGALLGHQMHTMAEQLHEQGRATAAFVSLQALSARFGLDQGFATYDRRAEKQWWLTAEEINERALPWLRAHKDQPFMAFVHYAEPHEPYLPPTHYQTIDAHCDGMSAIKLIVSGKRMFIKGQHGARQLSCVLTLHGDKPALLNHWKVGAGVALQLQEGWQLPGGERDPLLGKYGILKPGIPAKLLIRSTSGLSLPTFNVRISSSLVLTREEIREYYDLETEAADRALAPLWDLLSGHHLWEKTAVVFTADHGEELYEEPGVLGHVHHLRETLLHVPLIIAAPGHFPRATRRSELVSHVDVWPTLAPILGVTTPSVGTGRDLRSRSLGEVPHLAFTFRPQARHDLLSAQLPTLKLVRRLDTGTEQVFDLRRLPVEKQALVGGQLAEQRPVVQRLRKSVDEAQARLGGRVIHSVRLSEAEKDALRALGYLVPESVATGATTEEVTDPSSTASEPTNTEGRVRVGGREHAP